MFCLLKNDHNSHISQEDLLGWEVVVSFDQVVDSLETPLGEGKITKTSNEVKIYACCLFAGMYTNMSTQNQNIWKYSESILKSVKISQNIL